MTFLQKSCSEYNKVEKPVLVTTCYEGSNDEEELIPVPIVNNNNNVNVASDFNTDNNIKNNNNNFFDKGIDNKVNATPPKPLSMQR